MKRTITVTWEGTGAATRWTDKRNKEVVFKNCVPFTDCISEMKNIRVNNARFLDVVMLMYNLIEYSDDYSKIPEIFWQYYRDEPGEGDNTAITDSE